MNKFYNNAKNKGFWDDCKVPLSEGLSPSQGGPLSKLKVDLSIPLKLALIHSEVSEVLEAYRKGETAEYHLTLEGKPVGLASELADVVIRCYDLAGALDIDLDESIDKKHKYNETRPMMHGKRC